MNTIFRHGAKKIISDRGHGSKVQVYNKMGIKQNYLNDLLTGRRKWSINKRESR